MKKIAATIGMAVLVLAAGCLEQAGTGPRSYKGPLFRYHFAGRAHLPTGTNATRFKEIDALPATTDLRAQLAQKLAIAALPFWQKDLPAGATDQSALLRPLLDDFLVAEAYVEVRGAPGRTDTVLALELSDERARLWDKNLKQLAAAWKFTAPSELTAEGFKGWDVRKPQAPNVFQFFRAGKWVVLGLGQDRIVQLPPLLTEARKSGRPLLALNDRFLDLAADIPGLRAWFPLLAKCPLPPVVATMAGRGENVRTEVKFQYSSRIPIAFEPWKIPTNIISEPLTSFTVGQGIAPLLGQVKGFSEVGLNPLPNQFCAWGINHEQWRMFFTIPVANATNVMRRIAARIPTFVQSRLTNAQGQFLYNSNRAEVIWGGLPWIAPMVHPEKDGRDEYLLGAVFPPSPQHTPVPDELFAQVRGRTNLVYYDWEITEQRLTHGKQFYQLASIVNQRRLPSTNTASQRWISAIGSKLGNAVTEITQTGPQELAMVRKSHLGFTGFEIATFSAWLDSTGFPFTFDLPAPLPRSVTNARPARAMAPGAPVTAPARTVPVPGANPPPPVRKP